MPAKAKRLRSSTQVKSEQAKAKQKSQNFNQLQKEYTQYKRDLEKARKASARARDKEYRGILKAASKTGLYKPKSEELTKYRRSRARQIKRDYGDYLDPKKYFFLPLPKNKKSDVIKRADTLKITTSRTGIFYPKEGHKTASIKKDKKRDEYYIERRGKTKTGINKGLKYRDVTPIATLDELDNERERLRRAAKRLGKMGENDFYAFVVVENGLEGYSHYTFRTIEQLISHIDSYPKNVAAKINFFRHIKVVKTQPMTWKDLHPTRSPGKAGRRYRGKNDTRRSK